jgi:GAF domain-containing protein
MPTRPARKKDTRRPPAAGMRGWFTRGRQPAQAERPPETPAERPVKQPGRDKRQAAHLDLLKEVASSLSSVLDQPVAAQLVVNAVQRAFDACRTFILVYDTEHREFALQAMAGKNDFLLPPSYRLSSQKGLPGKAYRLGTSLLVNDTRQDADYLDLTEHPCLSELVIPFVQHNLVKGVLVLDEFHTDAFDSTDLSILESVAEQLLIAWERAGYHQRLTELIQSGITLSTILDPQTAIQQVAEIAKKALAARFVFVTLMDQEGGQARIASAGVAPGVLRSLKKIPGKNPLIKATLNAKQIMRLRDVRKSSYAAHVHIEQAACRSMLSFPIRLHQLSVGAVLAFGKIGEPFFSESDESLAELLASLSAASIENTWLYQELRSTLNNATLLHQMGIRILQADSLRSAAQAIAQTAFRLGHASVAASCSSGRGLTASKPASKWTRTAWRKATSIPSP